jgi:hypothetical protein
MKTPLIFQYGGNTFTTDCRYSFEFAFISYRADIEKGERIILLTTEKDWVKIN